MKHRLEEFLVRIDAARSVQETWEENVSFQRSLGFDLVEYGYSVAGAAETGVELANLSNFPSAYRERYRREHYHRDDPVVRYCIDNLPPLRVGRDFLGLWPNQGRGLTAVQRRIVEEAADCGMVVGVVFPLRSPGRFPLAGMSLSNSMRPAEFNRFMARWGQIAQLAALYAHNRLQMLLQKGDAASDVTLSSRERECLQWVSRGLSSKETAQRLDLSPKTVDFYIASAMSKLEVSTRSHAVARAIIRGFLEP
jgi:Response regulator containing a CheY-like receiver domain and an HTH DNA-binding domain